jgi:SAM-dependent methyltransferase
MNIKALLNFLFRTPITTLYWINRSTLELYRATFVSSGLAHGIYDTLVKGPSRPEEILAAMGAKGGAKELEAWLDVGVSLGELQKTSRGYALKGALSTELAKESEESWRAYLEARIKVLQTYIWKAPQLIKEGKRLQLGEGYAELFAKCSLTIEPIMEEVVDYTIPKSGALSLLEVGCGSGDYIKRACARNPRLEVVGLESQESVANYAAANIREWGLDERVSVEVGDIRNYSPPRRFHIITLHNLIYYFPESERVDLLKSISGLLQESGKVAITCLCKTDEPSSSVLNLWGAMTEGCGPAPDSKNFLGQMKEAGFENVKDKKLVGSFHLFLGMNSAQKNGK